jgi:hypothetical protein
MTPRRDRATVVYALTAELAGEEIHVPLLTRDRLILASKQVPVCGSEIPAASPLTPQSF